MPAVPLQSWSECQAELAHLAQRQLFFVGGAPRSGTTWLQQMLDCHPDVSCRGEGLFGNQLAAPLDGMMAQRRQALDAKNTKLFRHTGGFPLPAAEHADILLGTAVLLALHQQSAGKQCLAIGEKTPENVFLYPRLRRIFPTSKLIAIARDPRDVLASAWHFFHTPAAGEDEVAAKIAFIRSALPSLGEGARAMLTLAQHHPADVRIVTYEGLRRMPAPIMVELFRFLGVSDREDIVQHCLAQTSFAAMTGRHAPSAAQERSFFRKGAVGDWTSTLTPDMSEMVLRELGWSFPQFGWQA